MITVTLYVRDACPECDQALADLPKNARIGILAHASSTIPYLLEEPG